MPWRGRPGIANPASGGVLRKHSCPHAADARHADESVGTELIDRRSSGSAHDDERAVAENIAWQSLVSSYWGLDRPGREVRRRPPPAAAPAPPGLPVAGDAPMAESISVAASARAQSRGSRELSATDCACAPS